MIYIRNTEITLEEFEKLLEDTKNALLSSFGMLGGRVNTISGNEFESMVYEEAKGCAKGTKFEDELVHTADREFPDIVAADYYGIEVKATKKDDWTSIGNSVLESSRVLGVEKIYMFFGKLGGRPDIRYRNYEECLKGISVTHYPRYQIDMNLPSGESIFDKMDVPYDEVRNMDNPIKVIRRYYKSQMDDGDSLWWIDDDSENIPALSPVIRNFSSLSVAEKDKIVASIMAYFPEVFRQNATKKYERIPAFLASQYGVVCQNIRDLFSAGGQVELRYDGVKVFVPQVVSRVSGLAKEIQSFIKGKSKEELENLWGHKIIFQAEDAEQAWCKEVDRQLGDTNHPELITREYLLGTHRSDDRQ